jgi:hypothetical protein
MVTLTRERVLEAAPLDSWRRAELQALLEQYPCCEDKVFWEAWEQLIKWYRCECKEIGERQAFWGEVPPTLTPFVLVHSTSQEGPRAFFSSTNPSPIGPGLGVV